MITHITSSAIKVPHGFLGRTGGVSEGIFASLNVGLGSSDAREAVAENRRRAVATVAPGACLVTLHQVHSARVVEAGDWSDAARPEADALVSNRPGMALGILTADCAPVLLADAKAGVIAAAHAGWKGAVGGILEASVEAMVALGAKRDSICAAVGPCIAQLSYEVGKDFRARFIATDKDYARFFTAGAAGHSQFDLEGFCVSRLVAAGVGHVDAVGRDTYAAPQDFFSFRRTTHAGEPDYGRQMSLITLD